MLTYSTIAGGQPADTAAMTNHLLTQTLPREVADLVPLVSEFGPQAA